MQPTAQAVGRKGEGNQPRRGERLALTHSLKPMLLWVPLTQGRRPYSTQPPYCTLNVVLAAVDELAPVAVVLACTL